MFHKAEQKEEIHYVDFCSLYPAVMCSEQYPLRYPSEIILNPPINSLNNSFGLVKALILPPQNIPIAVLPFRHEKGGKIFYTLCKTCSKELNVFLCFHTQEQRQFTGTYTTFELQNAVKHGYTVIQIFEMWNWNEDERSSSVFKPYIRMFFRMKLASEGYPSTIQTKAE